MTVRPGWLGFALAAGWVAAYYAYTPGGIGWLERGMRWPRRLGLVLALALSAAPLLQARGGAGNLAALAPLLATIAAVAFATWRQWLWPPRARSAVPTSGAVDPDSTVVVLPGGDALLFDGLPRRRVVQVGDVAVAHCSFAGSLGAFRIDGPVRPSLPLRAGFEIEAGARRWDAVDGRARDGGANATQLPIALCTERAWRARFPRNALFSVSSPAERPHSRPRRVFGVLERGAWRPLSERDLEECPPDIAATPERLYIDRWAAEARGLL